MVEDKIKESTPNLKGKSGVGNMGQSKLVGVSRMSKSKPTHGKHAEPKVAANVIKLPSDTTIYAPALKLNVTPPVKPKVKETEFPVKSHEAMEVSDEIAKFLQSVRLTQEKANNEHLFINSNVVAQQAAVDDSELVIPPRPDNSDVQELARKRAEKTIVEAEKFTAGIDNPPGMLIYGKAMGDGIDQTQVNLMQQIGQQGQAVFNQKPQGVGAGLLDIGKGASDNDFFHLTCHIELNLIHKIEKGEFVELEKLLPKDKCRWLLQS